MEGISIYSIRKINFIGKSVKISLLCEKRVPSKLFIIPFLTVQCYRIDVILGDFNIDAYDSEEANLVRVLSSYDMVVNDATHISGSLLGQVFVGKYILREVGVTWNNFSTFFSYHDSVRVTFQIKS